MQICLDKNKECFKCFKKNNTKGSLNTQKKITQRPSISLLSICGLDARTVAVNSWESI